MKSNFLLSLALVGAFSYTAAQERTGGLLARRYQEGETLVYHMKAANEGRPYEAQASGVVKKDASGVFVEEYAWSNLVFNGNRFTLPTASAEFRQLLSLDPRKAAGILNLAAVHPNLIGPITDLLTFYVDLWLAERVGHLSKAGDHLYHEHGTPASWADGNYCVLGEDSIDFDITLKQVDLAGKAATLVVRHVPPKQPQVKLPTAWMREPVAGTPINWVNVTRNGGKYVAEVGQETFDVQLTVSLVDGKILAATMDNPVKAQERECQDAAFEQCGDPRPHEILRKVEISLVE